MTLRINDNGTDRDMTAEEEALYNETVKQTAKEEAAKIKALETTAAAKASAKAKLLALGLTDSEIEALLGVSRG